MRCTKCGHKLRIGDEFCSKCGTAIEPDIEYEENDVRDDRIDRNHTRAYKAQRDYEQYDRKNDERHTGARKQGDEFQENMHDITGEINLDDYDPEDSRPRKFSKWTGAGIAAAIGIAAAFVIAIVALNVQNIMKGNEETQIGEAEETTTAEKQTETAAEETNGSAWKNPFESLFPSQREDNKNAGNSASDSYGSDYSNEDSSSYNQGGSSSSYEGGSSGSDYGQREDSPSSGQYYEDSSDSSSDYSYNDDSSSSNTYDSESSSDYYSDEPETEYHSDESYYDENGSSDAGIMEFFEGIGGQIRDTAEDWGTQLDESINNYRERIRGRGW